MRQFDQVRMLVVKVFVAEFAVLDVTIWLVREVTQNLEGAGCFVRVSCCHDSWLMRIVHQSMPSLTGIVC